MKRPQVNVTFIQITGSEAERLDNYSKQNYQINYLSHQVLIFQSNCEMYNEKLRKKEV